MYVTMQTIQILLNTPLKSLTKKKGGEEEKREYDGIGKLVLTSVTKGVYLTQL